MSTIAERIKQLRKSEHLTQQRFADRLGLKQNTVATYEMGRSVPIDPIITSICREFGVNEDWLRTGEGSMKQSTSREEEIEALMRSALKGSNDFKKAVIQAVCTRSESELEVLEKMLWDIVYNLPEKKKGQDES